MKPAWFILLGGLLLGSAAYALIYLGGAWPKDDKPAVAWLRQEYHLNNAQFDRVCQLYDAYQPKCQEMCRKIDEKNGQLQRLLAATNVVTPEIKRALAETAQCRVECQAAMLEHFYEVAHVMPREQGQRYLGWVQEATLMPGHMPPTQAPGTSRMP